MTKPQNRLKDSPNIVKEMEQNFHSLTDAYIYIYIYIYKLKPGIKPFDQILAEIEENERNNKCSMYHPRPKLTMGVSLPLNFQSEPMLTSP